jgi:hypothetical protein
VAEALAGNTRAMVQVGSGGDVADALILDTLAEETAPGPSPRRRRPKPTSDANGDA